MMAAPNIWLVGPMGAGKTTIGRLVARQLGREFLDSDHEVEARAGADIPWIFDIEGEAGFRRRERAVIEALGQRRGLVIATGGGAVLDAGNRAVMAGSGIVVYLCASVERIHARTRRSQHRPLLQTTSPRATIRRLVTERDPLYREIAALVVDTERRSARGTTEWLVRRLRELEEEGSDMATAMHETRRTLTVELGARSYPIHIGPGLLAEASLLRDRLAGTEVLIVTNETIAPLWLVPVEAALEGLTIATVVLPDGESWKNSETLMRIHDSLLERRFGRRTTIVALGGGVVGDMAGFAAATYQRGVAFVQVPTSLLAQVDSSVGGKTGINHRLGKNMIGAFHQPRAVIIDTRVLDTLPDRELRAGLAEVIKYGLIADPALFEWLEENLEAVLGRRPDALMHIIEASCRTKAEVVAEDEREGGRRAILNLGHTFGHAIETGLGYGTWLHGEAIAAGMVAAADLSVRLGWLAQDAGDRARRLIERAGLPVALPGALGVDRFLELMAVDKKVDQGMLRLVLLEGIGTAVVTADFGPHALRETLTACRQPAS